jgi:hemerythrin-like domain-containing protein
MQQLALISNALAQSQSLSPEKLLELIDHLGSRIAKHFAYEEKILYKPLKMKLEKDSPTDEIILDHELIRRDFEILRRACVQYGTSSSSVVLQRCLDPFQRELSEHLRKEERVLFWLAEFKLS